jgi:AcrR family transcriptional regulator
LTSGLYSSNDVFDEIVTRRRYRLGKRAEAAAGTRRRIVVATLQLHDAQGITGTSVRDIAGRAGVAPATVLQHFPQMDELIRACGELSDQLAPMPTEAIFIGEKTLAERIRRMVLALFEWWEQLGDGFDHLRIDRRHLTQVDAWFADVARRHRDLAAAALAGAGTPRVDLLVALTTVDAWRSLRDSGMDASRAAGQVAELFAQSSSSTRKAYH